LASQERKINKGGKHNGEWERGRVGWLARGAIDGVEGMIDFSSANLSWKPPHALRYEGRLVLGRVDPFQPKADNAKSRKSQPAASTAHANDNKALN
jgi:hypothetical protein